MKNSHRLTIQAETPEEKQQVQQVLGEFLYQVTTIVVEGDTIRVFAMQHIIQKINKRLTKPEIKSDE